MKTQTLQQAFSVVLFVMVLVSCSSNLSYQQALEKNRRTLDNMDQVDDARFLVEAQSFNLLETKINEIAAEKGYSSDLVNFARRNVETHKDVQKELSKLSRKAKMKVPSEMKEEHQRVVDDLTATGRADFDAHFVDVLKDVNSENTRLYEEYSTEANNGDVRAYAARNLGYLRAHAEQLEQVDDQLMQTHR
jgi:putative membrane protein